MRRFHCEACAAEIAFDSSSCPGCAAPLGYVPDERTLRALRTDDAVTFRIGASDLDWWRCLNAAWGCNWLLPAASGKTWCRSCALTRGRPDDARPAAVSAWTAAEANKRRLVHQLDRLGLPVEARRSADSEGLVFDLVFLPGARGLTGHLDGVVTVDLAEADPIFCEQMRRRLGEPFRTLLGSLRHEVAHYYWSVLVRDAGCVESFRAVFGDERVDYPAAVEHYYASPPAWDEARFVSRYAQAHPHEDWAETFALYLHIVDLVDTAAAHGLIDLPASGDDRLPCPAGTSIDDLVARWVALAAAIDGLADSVGAEWLRPAAAARLQLDKLGDVHARITRQQPGG